MAQEIILTEEGYQKLQAELEDLKKVKRKEVAERIQLAKDFGDLSENAEYHEAKEAQGFIEGRIIEIEHILKVAQIATKVKSSGVAVSSVVTLEKDGQLIKYHLVGATEADPLENKISIESPLGTALFNRKIGDIIEVNTPMGSTTYIIKEIA